MVRGILGRKVGMTQIFQEDGTAVPVTVIQAGPCHVLQVRTMERDGYEAVQLGFLDKPRRLASRSERGHVAPLESKRSKRLKGAGVEVPAKANCEPKRFVREFRGAAPDAQVGSQVDATIFEGVAAVDVIGTSKDVVTPVKCVGTISKGCELRTVRKRTIVTLDRPAGRTSPGRVFKGLKMSGRYGNTRVTARNLKVVRIDAANNLLMVRGAVPGPIGGHVLVSETNKVG